MKVYEARPYDSLQMPQTIISDAIESLIKGCPAAGTSPFLGGTVPVSGSVQATRKAGALEIDYPLTVDVGSVWMDVSLTDPRDDPASPS